MRESEPVDVLPYIFKAALLADNGLKTAGRHRDRPADQRHGQGADTREWHAALTVGHLNVAGSKVGSHTNAGHEIELLPGHVDRLAEVGPVLLGHIHASQTVGKAQFVGDIFPQDYGDYRPKHYVVAKHTDADGWKIIERPIKTFRFMLDSTCADNRARQGRRWVFRR